MPKAVWIKAVANKCKTLITDGIVSINIQINNEIMLYFTVAGMLTCLNYSRSDKQ